MGRRVVCHCRRDLPLLTWRVRSARVCAAEGADGRDGSRKGTADRAILSLWRMVRENPEHKVNIARAGGAEPLVTLLRDGSGAAQEYALWSLSLAIDESFIDIFNDKVRAISPRSPHDLPVISP